MSTKIAISDTAPRPFVARWRRDQLTRRAWGVVVFLPVSYLAAYAVGTGLMALLDVAEGELLVSAGPGGWAAALTVLTLMVAPAAAGVVLARRARRAGGGRAASAALVVNAVLLAWLTFSSLSQLVLG